MDYTTLQLVKNYTLLTIDSSFDSQIERWIEGASRMMDQICNRQLVADEVAVARYYDGKLSTQLIVDDFVAITEVAMSADQYGQQTYSPITNYVTYPKLSDKQLNARGLILTDGYFQLGYQNVKVTARWGYLPQITPDLEFVCTVLVSGIIMAQTNGQQNKKSEKIGNYAVTYTDEKGWADYYNALKTLDTYKKISF